jgi:hypothetical protein
VFRNLKFLTILKALKYYISIIGWLCLYLLKYAQVVKPIQKRKIELLEAGQSISAIGGKYKNYIIRIIYDPTP